MSGDIVSNIGTRIFIGPVVTATPDTKTEYEALTYVEIGLVESLGEFGDESGSGTFTSLNDGRVRKYKNVRDAGNLALTVARDVTDPGQTALVAAEATRNGKYAFKVVYPDRLTENGTDGADYFRALVRSKRNNPGAGGNVLRRSFMIDIDSAIVEVDPT